MFLNIWYSARGPTYPGLTALAKRIRIEESGQAVLLAGESLVRLIPVISTFFLTTGESLERSHVDQTGDITQLLQRWREGNRDAENELFALVLPNLRRLAHYLMKRERKGHSMQATELVDQVYFRLVAAKDRDWRNRQHFFAIAARAMRRYLIDHARARPDGEFVALEGMKEFLPADSAKVDLAITVDRAVGPA